MRSIAPGAEHGRGAGRVVAPDHHQRHAQHLSHLPGDGGEHRRRRRPSGDEYRDPSQRRLLRGEDRIVLAQHLVSAQARLDVAEGHDRPTASWHLDRHGDVGDREHRAVAPEEPVQLARDRVAGSPREQQRAVRRGKRGAVRVLVVDRLVAAAPEELVSAAVAQRRDRGRIGEPDHVVGVHDPYRLCRRLEYGGEEILGADAQVSKIGQGLSHSHLRA